jgi:type IV secretory pathway VirB4 component
MKFEQIHSVQEFLQFESILDSGIIKMKDSSYTLIMKVEPINYNLRSELEKTSILNSYKLLFQNINFNIQILILSKQEDLEEHINKVKSLNLYPNLTDKYVHFLNSLEEDTKSSLKRFFIVIKSTNKDELEENYLKTKETLLRCGNIVSKLTKEKVKIVLESYMKVKR